MINRLIILLFTILTSGCGITEEEKREVAYIVDANLSNIKGVEIIDAAKMFSVLKKLNNECDDSLLTNNYIIEDVLAYLAIGWRHNIEYEIGIQCIEEIALKNKELSIKEHLFASIISENTAGFKRLYTTFRYNIFAEEEDQFGFLEYSIAYCKRDFFDFLASMGVTLKKSLWTDKQLFFFTESTCPELLDTVIKAAKEN